MTLSTHRRCWAVWLIVVDQQAAGCSTHSCLVAPPEFSRWAGVGSRGGNPAGNAQQSALVCHTCC